MEFSTLQRSTCLFCTQPVFVESNGGNSESDMERSNALKTLCHHMQLDYKEIPTTCVREMFPFCKDCEKLVTMVKDKQKTINEAQEEISKCIAAIERTVVDGEILLRFTTNTIKPGSFSMAATEGKKFVKLRDMMVDGYRTKLQRKQQLREMQSRTNTNMPPFNTAAFRKDPANVNNMTVNDKDSQPDVEGKKESIENKDSNGSASVASNTSILDDKNTCIMGKSDVRSAAPPPATVAVEQEPDEMRYPLSFALPATPHHLVCDVCGRRLNSTSFKTQHMETHNGRFKCGGCLVTYSFKHSRNRHCASTGHPKPT